MEYTINKVPTERFSMEYIRFGTGKRPFVILPGLSVQSTMNFAPAVVNRYRRFSDRFTVYVFDRRSDPPEVYNIFQMADDTAYAFEKTGLSDISLFGASQGGMIGMTIAAVFPGMISKLSVSSTAMRMDENRFGIIRKWVELAEKKDKSGLYLSIGSCIYPEGYFERFRDAFAMISKTVTDEELARFLIFANGMKGFDLTDKIGRIQCPVQLSYDENDPVIIGNAASEIKNHLSARIGSDTKSFGGYGHALYDTAPGFTEWLYDFFV